MLWQSLVESVYFFKNNFFAIAAIILPIAIPIELFDALYENFVITDNSTYVEQSIPFIVMLLASPLYAIAVIFYIASQIKGEAISVKTAWQFGIKYWQPYLALTILLLIIFMLGFMLLFIPGVILVVRYAFAEFELLFNNKRPIDAMKSSWAASGQCFWKLLGGFFIIASALYIPLILIQVSVDDFETTYPILDSMLNILYSVPQVLLTIFSYRVYVQIVGDKDVMNTSEVTDSEKY